MYFAPHQNEQMNKYMEHQVRRLADFLEKGEPKKFWFVAEFCMKRSVSFRVSAINKVFHN